MEERRANIYLKTPLFRFKYVFEGEERQLLENAVRVEGTIVRETSAGIQVKVDQVSNLKTVERELPFEEIFIPFDKIDHILLLD